MRTREVERKRERLRKLASANLAAEEKSQPRSAWSEATLGKLIRRESQTVELKGSFGWSAKSPNTNDRKAQKDHQKLSEQVYRTVGGFLNAEGGVLIVGVEDESRGSTVIGIEKGKLATIDDLIRDIRNKLTKVFGNNAMSVNVSVHPLEGREVCVIDVRKVPKAKASRIPGRPADEEVFWARIDNETHELKGSKLVDYFEQRLRSEE